MMMCILFRIPRLSELCLITSLGNQLPNWQRGTDAQLLNMESNEQRNTELHGRGWNKQTQ